MADADQGKGFASLLHKFGAVQAVFLFVGFVIFLASLPNGVKVNNRTLMIGVCVMALGIVGHYWSKPRDSDFFDGQTLHRGGFRWCPIFLGVLFLSASCIAAYLAYISN